VEGRRAYVPESAAAALPPLAATDGFLPESPAAMVASGDRRQSATRVLVMVGGGGDEGDRAPVRAVI
jgi:hypothetical protein